MDVEGRKLVVLRFILRLRKIVFQQKLVFPGCVPGSRAHLRVAELLNCPQLSKSDRRQYTVARSDEGIVLNSFSRSSTEPLTSNQEGEDDGLPCTLPLSNAE